MVTTDQLMPTRLRVKLAVGFLGVLLALPVAGSDTPVKSTSDQPPRKVIIGTVMQPFWVPYPGLQNRLDQLTGIVDRMQAQSEKTYGRSLDLAVLPEMAVSGAGRRGGKVTDWAIPLAGAVQDSFAREARKCHCYIVVPMYLREDPATNLCSNAAILFDRRGEVVGIYRKVQLVVDTDSDSDSLEHGSTPGMEEPVFPCDFGKLGIQICYDMDFDYGWKELARKGAELVAWPSQSPQTSQPAARAKQYRLYVVSSTWRNNASIFEPTGKIVSQVIWPKNPNKVDDGIPPEDNVLVQEIDLNYAILPWSSTLKNGAALKQAFGDKVGYRFYEDEDLGMFWSNDPHMTIRQMLRSLGLIEQWEELQHAEEVYHKAGVPGY